jgi:hypothetical protein
VRAAQATLANLADGFFPPDLGLALFDHAADWRAVEALVLEWQ